MFFLITTLLTSISTLGNNPSPAVAYKLEGQIVSGDSSCQKKPIDLWLSQGKQLLFQSIVPVGGTYSFYVRPGQYNLIATSTEDCFQGKVVNVTTQDVIENFDVKPSHVARNEGLKKADRMPASTFRGPIMDPGFGGPHWQARNQVYYPQRGRSTWPRQIPTYYSDYTEGTYCPACELYRSPLPYNNQWMARRYSNFGQMMYSNHSFPCAWQGIGCASNYYPSGGPVMMGKPNVYFENVPKDGAKVSINLPNKSRMIATVPIHKPTWEVSPAKDGNIVIGGVSYPYIHYDYRAYLDGLQNTKGFCTGPDDLIEKLESILKIYQFTESSINDFTVYFKQKIPPDHSYCVYPQLETDIQSMSILKTEPQPEQLVRINFIVVPGNTRKLTSTKFRLSPKENWKADPPESSSGFTVREWGMGFLVGEKAKSVPGNTRQ